MQTGARKALLSPNQVHHNIIMMSEGEGMYIFDVDSWSHYDIESDITIH